MTAPEPQVRFARLPVDGRWPITGRFGDAYSDGSRTWTHLGVDFGCPAGTPVWAPADGVVVQPANDGSFGTAVCLRHGDGWHTLYAHLSRAEVALGQQVRAGDRLGLSGATGFVTGPHLHWQLCDTWLFPRDPARNRDPLQYLAKEDEMTPEERELLLRLATVVFGPPTGADYQTVGEALIEARRLTAQDSVLLLGLAETQRWLAQHTHDASGRAQWPGKPPF